MTAPLTVDGAPIFRIAAPSVPTGGELPIDVRLLFVQNAISQLLSEKDNSGTVYDPRSLKISIDRVGAQQTLVATDDKHPDEVPILTITSADAQYARVPAESLADQWRPLLQHALVAALVKRQPAVIRSNLDNLSRAVATLIVVTILGLAFRYLVNRRIEALKPRRAIAGSIAWLLVLAWAATATWASLLFPQTSGAGQLVVRTSANIAIIWICAALVNRLADVVIAQFAEVYARRGVTSENRARRLLRAPTIARSLGGFKGFVIAFVATLTTLSAINISIASVVTIGGVAALAIGFAAQSLVRDFLNGLLVLFEDQYVVGDFVMIGEFNGIVEHLSLRIVQLRDARGSLITIPHSAVSHVVNASRDWSRVDFRIAIDVAADLSKAISTLRATLEKLENDRVLSGAVRLPVEWIGVESASKNGVVLRAAIRTEPLRQFELSRSINHLVVDAFKREGIALGIDPQGLPVPSVTASPDPL